MYNSYDSRYEVFTFLDTSISSMVDQASENSRGASAPLFPQQPSFLYNGSYWRFYCRAPANWTFAT